MTAIIVILFCIAIGPYGWFWLFVFGCIYLFAPKTSSSTTDRHDWRPINIPGRADSDLGELDFHSYEWEQVGEDSVRNIKNGVTFTRQIGGYWTADDEDGSGNNSEYYGWYSIED